MNTSNEFMELQLLSIKSVAAILAVSDRAVWRLISTRELEVVHIGRSARVPQASLKQFIENSKTNGGKND